MDADPFFVSEGDIDAARELVKEAKYCVAKIHSRF
jgi:hypothetical protein